MSGFFTSVPLEPPNSILGLALECRKDPAADKIDLTIGAYRDDTGKPAVLECVRSAEALLFSQKPDHEYLGQDGLPEFNKAAQILMFGQGSSVLSSGRVFTIQGISGTGSLRLACDFLATHVPSAKVFIPEVTWPNHPTMLAAAHVEQATYRYLDAAGTSLNFSAMLADITAAPEESIILLHNCAHNPTGVDPSEDEWRQILAVMKARNQLPFFDNAYQGFVTGCPTKDAFPVRLFAEAGLEMIVACSFAKNFGLYGERVGALHFVCANTQEVEKVGSQLRALARVLYSTCPAYGARLVAAVLNNDQSRGEWEAQCKAMADRLNSVRASLYQALVDLKVKGTWKHVIEQRGMFSYTGISAAVVARLKNEHHIYMLSNGRISLAGLNSSNTIRFAEKLALILGTNE